MGAGCLSVQVTTRKNVRPPECRPDYAAAAITWGGFGGNWMG